MSSYQGISNRIDGILNGRYVTNARRRRLRRRRPMTQRSIFVPSGETFGPRVTLEDIAPGGFERNSFPNPYTTVNPGFVNPAYMDPRYRMYQIGGVRPRGAFSRFNRNIIA